MCVSGWFRLLVMLSQLLQILSGPSYLHKLRILFETSELTGRGNYTGARAIFKNLNLILLSLLIFCL